MTMMMSAISMGPRVGGRATLHASRQEGRAGGIGPYPSLTPTDLVRGERQRPVLRVADRDPPVPIRPDCAHPHVTRSGHQHLGAPPWVTGERPLHGDGR